MSQATPQQPVQIERVEDTEARLKIVLDFLRDGMSIKDSLIMAEIEEDFFELYRRNNPRYDQLVKRKMTEYKYDVVKAINKGIKGADADPKQAQWIAEAKYSDEYSKKKPEGPSEGNQIANVIMLIQAGEAGGQTIPNASNAKVARSALRALKSEEDK